MTQISIRVTADKVLSVVRNTRLAVTSLPARAVKPEMEQARDEVARYPSELPNQRYVRTGKRGAATKLVSAPGNNQYASKYTIESTPSYGRGRTGNPYVLGDAQGQGQAAIHAGRWTKMFDAVNRAISRIVVKANDLLRIATERGS